MPPARAFALVLVVATSGCVSQLDMATVTDAGRAATTIPYNGVRGARTFADYESVERSILTGVDPAAPSAGAKSAKKKGGSK
jgi:hypothetical protein